MLYLGVFNNSGSLLFSIPSIISSSLSFLFNNYPLLFTPSPFLHSYPFLSFSTLLIILISKSYAPGITEIPSYKMHPQTKVSGKARRRGNAWQLFKQVPFGLKINKTKLGKKLPHQHKSSDFCWLGARHNLRGARGRNPTIGPVTA